MHYWLTVVGELTNTLLQLFYNTYGEVSTNIKLKYFVPECSLLSIYLNLN